MLKTILLFIVLMMLGVVFIPTVLRICKEQILVFVKEELKKDAEYRKMVINMKKGKK